MSNYIVKLAGTAGTDIHGLSYSRLDAYLCYNTDANKYYAALGKTNVALFNSENEATQAALDFRNSVYCYRGTPFAIDIL